MPEDAEEGVEDGQEDSSVFVEVGLDVNASLEDVEDLHGAEEDVDPTDGAESKVEADADAEEVDAEEFDSAIEQACRKLIS